MISPIGRALPHEPFADVVSDIEIRCRVQPQQLHEFPKIFVEKSFRAGDSRMQHDKADIEIRVWHLRASEGKQALKRSA